MINMITKVLNLYPKGSEKARACHGAAGITEELKKKVLDMLENGVSCKFISKTLGVCETTVYDLKVNKERY